MRLIIYGSNMDWAEVQARVQGIEGFISDNQAEYLSMCAKAAKSKTLTLIHRRHVYY